MRAFPVAGERDRVSPGAGVQPFWSPDGNTVYYLLPDTDQSRRQASLMAARIRRDPPFGVLRTDTIFTSGGNPSVMPHPDGKRFLMSRSPSGPAANPDRERFFVVTNWFEELKRAIPR